MLEDVNDSSVGFVVVLRGGCDDTWLSNTRKPKIPLNRYWYYSIDYRERERGYKECIGERFWSWRRRLYVSPKKGALPENRVTSEKRDVPVAYGCVEKKIASSLLMCHMWLFRFFYNFFIKKIHIIKLTRQVNN